MKKRLISVLLALWMLAGILPMIRSAALATDVERNEVSVSIKQTNIRADSVVNYEGHGSLKIKGNAATPAQLALINHDGTFVISYQSDPVGEYISVGEDDIFDATGQIISSDGIISITTTGSPYYWDKGIPQYYDFNGNPICSLEETESEYTDENGIVYTDHTSYTGGPMVDGYAVIIKRVTSFWQNGWAGGGDSFGKCETRIVDRNGKTTCTLPEAFNEEYGGGLANFSTKMMLGWCGDGLFAYVEPNWDAQNVVKGYMDPSGKTIIDLNGRGIQNAGPFSQGLAWVVDQDGKVGYIDKTGTQVIPCRYEDVSSFSSDGLCAVKMNGKWGYINKNGETVIPFEYDAAYGSGCGLAAVGKNGKYGLVDRNNKVIVPLEYDDISSSEGDVVYAIKDGAVDIITPSEKAVTRLPDGVKYIPYSSRTEDDGFIGTARYELDGTLPCGLSLDPKTSVISGVPMAAGTWEFQVRRIEGDTVQKIPLSLTIQDNTDVAVQQQQNDYPILEPVGTPDPQDRNHFYKNEYTDETMVIDAPYSEFHRVMIDGRQLVVDRDYTAEEGSTRITIRSQTFQKFGGGTHTIAAEFKPANASGSTIKHVVQNYTMNTSGNDNPASSQQTSVPFTDITPADWFYEDVVWAYQEGLIQGTGGNRFDPKGTVSQATIVTVLARIASIDLTSFDGETEAGFPEGQYYTASAIWAKRAGLLPTDGAFTGSATTTRNQMAVMLTKYLTSMGKDATPPTQPVTFGDAAEMSQEGRNAFQILYQYGIFKGTGGLKMEPAGSTTRAQFAALMHRIYDTAIN